MDYEEKLETGRQAIMRLRELLDLMREEIEWGERAYTQLFSNRTPEEIASLKHKDLQLHAAMDVVDDPLPLSDAALHLRFVTRNLERDFEQLYDNVNALKGLEHHQP